MTAPDPDVVSQVVALDEELRRALEERKYEVIERLYAPEFTINSPASRIQTRLETIDLLKRTQMRHVGVERRIESAYASGEDVVIVMGYESLVWEGTGSDLDGKRTARRFTNVWRRTAAGWQDIARQATTEPIDD